MRKSSAFDVQAYQGHRVVYSFWTDKNVICSGSKFDDLMAGGGFTKLPDRNKTSTGCSKVKNRKRHHARAG